MGAEQNGIGRHFARMEGYDSTVGSWVASPPFSAGGGGGGSTQVSVSSLAGVVTTNPFSTSWAGNAGFHFNSSGELLTAGAGGAGSTQVSVSNFSTQVTVANFSTQVSISGNSTVVQGTSPWVMAGNSTVVQGTSPWIIAGNSTVAPLAGSTWATRPVQSSAGDLQMFANLRDGSSQAIESSTRAQGTNSTMRGLAVRSLMPDSTFASGLAGSSGNTTILSSAANQIYVFSVVLGYAGVLSTNFKTIAVVQSGAGGTEMFRATWQMGANASTSAFNLDPYVLAVSPPAYLFRTAAGALLNLNASSSGVTFSVSGWRE